MLDRRRRMGWVVVLLAALVGLLLPTPAHAIDPFRPILVHQGPVAVLGAQGRGSIPISLRLVNGGPTDEAVVSLYPLVHARSSLQPIVDGHGAPGLPLATTGTFTLSCLNGDVARFRVVVTESAGSSALGCGRHRLLLRLGCQGGACDGVYPLSLTTTDGVVSTTIWSLLSISTAAVAHPLDVALVLATSPRGTTSFYQQAATLAQVARRDVACTIAVGYGGMARAILGTSAAALRYRTELAAAMKGDDHQLIDLGAPSVDFAALHARHLGASVAHQVGLGVLLAGRIGPGHPATPVELQGTVTPRDVSALAHLKTTELILPDRDLSPEPTSTLASGTPFHVAGASGLVSALATDAPLGQLATHTNESAGLRAALTLGVLAMVHFEAPFASIDRSDVVPLALGRTGAQYVGDLLGDLAHDPLLTPVGVSGLFGGSRLGANRDPRVWALTRSDPPSWSTANAQSVDSLYNSLTSLRDSTDSNRPTLGMLVQLLATESDQPASARQGRLNVVQAAFSAVLAQFKVDSTTITLAGSGADLPVTVTSTAPFAVNGFIELSGSHVRFPAGHLIPTTIDASTDSLRVPAIAAGSGNFTLDVRLLSSNRQLVLASAAIQVRSTSTSVVGWVLTVIAMLVIALWWWRTARKKTRARHAP